MLVNFTHAQWNTDLTGYLVTDQSVRIESGIDGSYPFSFIHNENGLWFAVNNSVANIFSVDYGQDKTYFSLKNRFGSELFKVSILQNDNSMYMHLPQENSRIIIGGYGEYLLDEGHKFIVKNGDAKIEGDFFLQEMLGLVQCLLLMV